MNTLTKLIENDDLENFKTHLNLEKIEEPITKIENYASKEPSKWRTLDIHKISYDDANVLKYAVHCNAEKIFNYLLTLTHVDKTCENYGWPILSMALQNRNYSFAHKIINHKSFNPYERYHNNCFAYIENRPDIDKHIDFLFSYLDKIPEYSFDEKGFLYEFSYLICYNENTFNRFEQYYRQRTKQPDFNLLDLYQEHIDFIAKEAISRKYKKFILEKLNPEQVVSMLKAVDKDDVIFCSLLESENAKEGLNYLLKAPEQLKQYFENKKVLFGYFNLESLQLIENYIDIWEEDKDNRNGVDYILNNDNLEEETTHYLLNTYTKKILERYENIKTNINERIIEYCQKKLFNDSLCNDLKVVEKKQNYPKI